MKKDKEWLKREIYAEYNDSNFILVAWDLIDQLDEPQKQVVTYFSPFTHLPVLVETETHKYFIDVAEIFRKGEQ